MNLPALLILLVVFLSMPAAALQQDPIDTLLLKSHTYFLSQDALAGRATGTPGEAVAAHYIASQCRRIGLEPVGGDFLHEVPLESMHVLPGTKLVLRSVRDTAVLAYPGYVLPNAGTPAALAGFSGRAVYVADGNAIERGGLGVLDLEDAIAVSRGVLSRAAFDTLAARGAAGALHLVSSPTAYQARALSLGERWIVHADSTVRSSFLPPIPSVLVHPSAHHLLLARGPTSALLPKQPSTLELWVAFHLQTKLEDVTGLNVACRLPGASASASDTAIAFTAHLDHLGIGVPDPTGDSIYNGFSDNAAGVAMLLAIAEAMAGGALERLQHSVLFLFFSGEERGLLGSDYYVHRPVWPLQRTAGVVNLDGGAPPAPPASWRLAGVDSTGLGAIGIEVGRASGWTITTSPPKPNSDYFPFVRVGVPAVFIIPGPGPYEGHTADSSQRLRLRWDRYHQPGDEWAEDFPFQGLARYAKYAYLVAQAIDRHASRLAGPGGH